MKTPPSFLADALAQIERGIVSLIGSANLHVRTAPAPRSLAARVRGGLRHLERILRRVVMLMALALLPELDPKKPRPRATTNPRVSKPRPLRALALLPTPLNIGGPQGFPDVPRATGPVPMRKLFVKFAALQTVLAAPEAHATRLAHRLVALIAAGEARPVVLPLARPKGASRHLAMIAEALPIHLKTALALWPNTS